MSDPYYELPKVGPYEVRIGSALITMVEPHVGHEHDYNRWYDEQHTADVLRDWTGRAESSPPLFPGAGPRRARR